MKRIAFLMFAVVVAAGVVAFTAHASGHADEEAAPLFGIKIPPGYRDWKLISVAHEAGNLDDLRALLGNDTAIKAYREDKLPFPDGTIIARLAWSYVSSEENNKVFGRAQSFVAGAPRPAFPATSLPRLRILSSRITHPHPDLKYRNKGATGNDEQKHVDDCKY